MNTDFKEYIQEFAKQYPEVLFTHTQPGAVITPLADSAMPKFVQPVLKLFANKPEDCAEFMLTALFQNKTGAWRRGPKGEDVAGKGWQGDETTRKRVWEHTVNTMKEAGVELSE